MTTFDQKYTIVSRLEPGGYGEIYSVINKDTSHPFVAKIQELDGSSLRELDILTRFNHPHLLHLEEFFMRDKELILIVPRAQGDLTSVKLTNVHQIIYEISSAVYFLTLHGVFHLDLKLNNILLFPDKSIKVADFGLICYQQEPYKCKVAQEIISLYYRPPEERQRMDSPRIITDQTIAWSLGIIFLAVLRRETNIYRLFNSVEWDPDRTYEHIVREVTLNLGSYTSFLKDPDVTHLLRNLLKLDPVQRIRIEDLFKDPFFQKNNYQKPIPGQVIEPIYEIVETYKFRLSLKSKNYEITEENFIYTTLALNYITSTTTETYYLSMDIYYRFVAQKLPLDKNRLYYYEYYHYCLYISNVLLTDSNKNLESLKFPHKKPKEIYILDILYALKGMIYPPNYFTWAFSLDSLLETFSSVKSLNDYVTNRIQFREKFKDRGKSIKSPMRSKNISLREFIDYLPPEDREKVFQIEQLFTIVQ